MIVVEGLDRLRRVLEVAEAIVEHEGVMILMDAVKDDAVARIKFDDVAPDGTKWKPWSEGYARTRSSNHKLLLDEGDLRDSLYIRGAGTRELQLLSDVAYAGYVHEARPFAGLSAFVEADFDLLVRDEFERRVSRV